MTDFLGFKANLFNFTTMRIIKKITTITDLITIVICITAIIISFYKQEWFTLLLSVAILCYAIKSLLETYFGYDEDIDPLEMDELYITLEKTPTGYSAYFDDLPVFTTGMDVPETLKNLCEAYELWQTHIDESYKLTQKQEEKAIDGQNT